VKLSKTFRMKQRSKDSRDSTSFVFSVGSREEKDTCIFGAPTKPSRQKEKEEGPGGRQRHLRTFQVLRLYSGREEIAQRDHVETESSGLVGVVIMGRSRRLYRFVIGGDETDILLGSQGANVYFLIVDPFSLSPSISGSLAHVCSLIPSHACFVLFSFYWLAAWELTAVPNLLTVSLAHVRLPRVR